MVARSSSGPSSSAPTPSEPAQQGEDAPAAEHPSIALPAGTQLRDEYEIEAVLGTGSFGITYRAHDRHLDTTVAIKEYYPRHLAGRTGNSITVRPHSENDADTFAFGLTRFREEGQMLARFDHPNVVKVHSYFEDNGTGYLVMDYYQGQTLAETLAHQGGALPEAEAVSIVQQVLDGLGPVHESGVLHRDIDPQNIYQTASDQVVLLDFGAAREAIGERSRSLSVILKPGYAPYEQYHDGDDQGPWTDVYACAATLYKCLTGLRPPEATRRLREDDLVSPHKAGADVSLDLSLAVMKGLALEPDDRPASATVFAEMLDEALRNDGSTKQASEGPSTETHPSDPPPRPSSSSSETASPSSPTTTAKEHETEETSPDAERRGSGRWGFFLVVAVVFGTSFGLDGGDGVPMVSFLGTWLVVSLGLIGLFREAEKAMSPESRAAVRDWLLQQDLAPHPTTWPSTFTSLFDAVFTEEHFSWTCFRRSALVSVATVMVLLIAIVGVGLIPTDLFWALLQDGDAPAWYNLLMFIGWAIAFNVIVDYLSLLETRVVLGRMAETNRTSLHLGYLGLDFGLTVAIFVGMAALIQPILYPFTQDVSASVLFTADGLQHLWLLTRDVFTTMWRQFLHANRPTVVMIYSTLFTSVWVWLYVGAGLLFRVLYPLLQGLDSLKRHFDVETRPVHTIGLLLAVMNSGLFVLLSPFVL